MKYIVDSDKSEDLFTQACKEGPMARYSCHVVEKYRYVLGARGTEELTVFVTYSSMIWREVSGLLIS